MINIIVMTHGEFGAYLIEAAEHIVGEQAKGVKNISISSRLSLEEMCSRVNSSIEEMKSGDGFVFLIDMPGGTPMNIVLPIVKDMPKTAVICGLNINMLTSAFSYRKTLDFDSLVEKIMEDGKKSICEVKNLLVKA
ncbi:MAG: hypothetical protein KAJ48_03135 [Elusimicrobiales bacterium]|nr:hypothetical protein [Elusimicrobiales bacterium]